MSKLKKKKKKNTVNVLIPEKPTANLTTSMRNELYSTPECFENTSSHQASSSATTTTNATTVSCVTFLFPELNKEVYLELADKLLNEGSELAMGMKKVAQMSSKKETPVKEIRNTDKELHKVVMEEMIEDGSKIPKIRFISDAELDHRNVEQKLKNGKIASAIPLWGLYETILTKKCIDEVVENFFSSPRDDIEVTMKLSRRDMYPRLHVELSPIYGDLHIEAARFRPFTTTGSRHGRFDDILRTDGMADYLAPTDLSMQSMESRSASMCCAKSSDATTARSPSYDYLSSAYSYVVAFVKSVVRNGSRMPPKTGDNN